MTWEACGGPRLEALNEGGGVHRAALGGDAAHQVRRLRTKIDAPLRERGGETAGHLTPWRSGWQWYVVAEALRVSSVLWAAVRTCSTAATRDPEAISQTTTLRSDTEGQPEGAAPFELLFHTYAYPAPNLAGTRSTRIRLRGGLLTDARFGRGRGPAVG